MWRVNYLKFSLLFNNVLFQRMEKLKEKGGSNAANQFVASNQPMFDFLFSFYLLNQEEELISDFYFSHQNFYFSSLINPFLFQQF